MKINLRLETPADYRAVEELTREAFWINTDRRSYIDEHFLVHKLRGSAAFVPKLDYVAEVNGRLAEDVVCRLPGMDAHALETIKATMHEHGRIWGK